MDPLKEWAYPVLVVAPHMDDEALGCGATIARLAEGGAVRVVFAGDGLGSFPRAVRTGAQAEKLRRRRQTEAVQAARELGLPAKALDLLGFEEWVFQSHFMALGAALNRILLEYRPATILYPFRYDRHTDHLAVHRAVEALTNDSTIRAREYFVYHRWQLLPGRDIRRWIRGEVLEHFDIGDYGRRKRRALESYESQVRVEPGLRDFPVLHADLIDEECRGREFFVDSRRAVSDRDLFRGLRWWIPWVHTVEPPLKRLKDALRRR
jgi:LmbE family N-acetylglucosaminyl deacetylase